MKRLLKYFPTAYERFATGIVLLCLSLPGMIIFAFSDHDLIFPSSFRGLRFLGAFFEWGTCLIALALIIWGVRDAASAGSLAFRLTHLNLRQRRDR